jgi:hypothetical protein
MKLSLECGIKGKIKIGKQLKAVKGSKEYLLIPDSKGWLSKMKIIKKVDVPDKYSAKIGPGKGKVNHEITISGDREEYLGLIREFQELESILSFDTGGSLKSIEWDAPTEDFIPETEEEEKQVQVHNLYYKKEHLDLPEVLDEKSFGEIIRSKERYVSLIVPQAFYREGANEFASKRYINAFYNFYFILEDLYGKGKTKNRAIGEEFRSSKEFRGFVDWVINDINNKYPKYRMRIERFCKEERVAYDTDGLIDLLLKVRGNLHHYSNKSSKHHGTPFSHEDFESIAFLTMGLAVRSILQRIRDINLSLKARQKGLGQ